MKSILTMFLILAGLFILSYCTGNKESPAEAITGSEMTEQQLIAKGEYLINIGGCHDCHSPKRMSENGPEIVPETMLSGYPADRPIQAVNKTALSEGWGLMNVDLTQAAGPWGVSFAANLTSDASGIGNWTEDQFRKALVEGKYKGMDGGRMLLPPMPWQNFKDIKDDDLKAIFTYLKSTKPVRNVVPAPIPPDAL